MSRAALRLVVLAAVVFLAAVGTGVALVPSFHGLLETGAGAADAFSASGLAEVHGHLGHAAAILSLPVAATGLLLGLHGLLSSSGRRLPATALAVLAPLALFWAMGAVYTGHAVWEPTHLGELQPEVLHGFVRLHGWLFGGGALAALALQGLALAWHGAGSRSPDEDD